MGIALAIFAWTAWNRMDAAADAEMRVTAELRESYQQQTDLELERQRDAAREALHLAEEREAANQEELRALKEKADDLLEQAASSDGSCDFDADTLRRLREIR